ncbi:hypothetical protein H9Y04_08150 [Streptomyces sp. TRM66268-LWL]|uniref:Uncharacterized protein n=1 Tax=Streptomyces polyasparticus TaxID=2767826 RepID=A0ABR7SDX5_9ACTN|nr:hypothetical protein [Streptomyces polyasparticus]MBC9712543.1 hypothetical protein [Streptomyces polyasparticus]
MGERVHTGGGKLLSRDEQDKWLQRLQHAVSGFVDAPHEAVREADLVVAEASERLTELLTQRRQELRRSWSGEPDGALHTGEGAGRGESARSDRSVGRGEGLSADDAGRREREGMRAGEGEAAAEGRRGEGGAHRDEGLHTASGGRDTVGGEKAMAATGEKGTAAGGEKGAAATTTAPDTERLRLALRDYRELAERLMAV